MTQDSIWYFKGIGEFKHLIERSDDRTQTVAEALSTYRETKCLGNRFKQMTIQELVDQPRLIIDLAEALRNGMAPQSQFKLPYRKTEREQELIEDLAMNYRIDRERAVAKIVTGYHKNENTKQAFPYCLEAVMAPRTDVGSSFAGVVDIIGNINSSLSINYGEGYFDASSHVYQWPDKKAGWKSASNLRGILSEYGFTTAAYMSKRRFPSVLYINLNTPCPDWLGGAGKTHIDLKPYARDIAETVKLLACKMPSYYGKGFAISSYSDVSDQQKSAKEYLEDFLWARYRAMYGDPEKGTKGDLSLIYRDALTQSSVWYRMRPIMIDGDFKPEKNWGKTREYITGEIDKMCKELFDCEREELGIYAKAKGMMFYDGNVYPVDFQSIEALSNKGVFILVIEKEDIAKVIKDAVRGYAVALVHTGGRYTKYVKWLMRDAKVPCAQVTDYDADGIRIAEDVGFRPRIGIDRDIVTWLQKNGYPEIKLENVEEEYTPRITPDDEYLKTKRIELDSINAAFPDTPGRGPQALWDYIKYKIEELQKEEGFDYSNVISRPKPEELYPESVKTFISKLDGYIEKITEESWDKIVNGKEEDDDKETEEQDEPLVKVMKLISVKDRKKKNLDTLGDILVEDDVIQDEVIPRVDEMLEELGDLEDLD